MYTPKPLLLLTILALSFIPFAYTEPLSVCRGLVLQGGSDKGAYQAGVLQGLLKALGSDALQYDVISGITIGAINAAWMSQFPKGQEELMVDELANFWLTVKASDMYKNWPAGVVQGLLFEPSIYNNAPSMEYLKSHITQSPQRYVAIGAANANLGTFNVFSNFVNQISVDDFLTAVMASNGIAGLFPYVDIAGSIYFDGSVLKSMDVASVVHQCRTLNGGIDANIEIDMILLSEKTFPPLVDGKKLNSIQMLLRTLSLSSYHDAMYSLIRSETSFPDVKFRYVIKPSKNLPDSILPMDYDHKSIVTMMEQGQQDAMSEISKGPGASFDEIVGQAKAARDDRYGLGLNSEAILKQYFDQVNEILREHREKELRETLEI